MKYCKIYSTNFTIYKSEMDVTNESIKIKIVSIFGQYIYDSELVEKIPFCPDDIEIS